MFKISQETPKIFQLNQNSEIQISMSITKPDNMSIMEIMDNLIMALNQESLNIKTELNFWNRKFNNWKKRTNF